MASTILNDINAQIQEEWSPRFMAKLRERSILAQLVNREYQGEITSSGGNTVKVSAIDDVEGEIKTIDSSGAHVNFNPEKIVTQQVEVVANKRIVASFEVDDLISVQSQLGQKNSELLEKLAWAGMRKLNTYLYSLVAPSTSAPDHVLSGVATFDATAFLNVRNLAAQANWEETKGWWLLLDPIYYGNLLAAQTLTSSDYVGGEMPTIGGKIINKRFGFNVVEDTSVGMRQISPTSASDKLALAFHPDFLYLVMQYEPRIMVSSQHSAKSFSNVMSVDFVVGAKLGIEGSVKHITTYED